MTSPVLLKRVSLLHDEVARSPHQVELQNVILYEEFNTTSEDAMNRTPTYLHAAYDIMTWEYSAPS